MTYLLLYLAVGAITLVATLVQERSARKKHGRSLGDALYELRRDKASLWTRFAHEILLPALTGLVVICFWPVALFWLIKHAFGERQRKNQEEESKFRVRQEDLIEQLSIEEIERRERVDDPLGGTPDKPLGHLSPAWTAFVEELGDDSTLWSFAATDDSGYEAVRLEGYVDFSEKDTRSMFVTARRQLSQGDV
jgi:hypothetical protein